MFAFLFYPWLYDDPVSYTHLDVYKRQAFELISEAINLKKKVYIFGDYDVDGVTATAIMYNTLKELGADVYYRLPDRLTEGYGMTVSYTHLVIYNNQVIL